MHGEHTLDVVAELLQETPQEARRLLVGDLAAREHLGFEVDVGLRAVICRALQKLSTPRRLCLSPCRAQDHASTSCTVIAVNSTSLVVGNSIKIHGLTRSVAHELAHEAVAQDRDLN